MSYQEPSASPRLGVSAFSSPHSGTFTESEVEDAALAWLEGLGYTVFHGPEIAPGEPFAERETYTQVVLAGRLRQALTRLNPSVPPWRSTRPSAS